MDMNQHETISSLIRALRVVREELGRVPLERVEALLQIALDEGAVTLDHAERLDVSPAAMSGHLRDLSENGMWKRKGPGLVVTTTDPKSGRFVSAELSPKGRELVAKMAHQFNGGSDRPDTKEPVLDGGQEGQEALASASG